MKIDSYKCDGCGAMKRETNHWFVVSTDPRIVIWPWGDVSPKGYLHLCSDACVVKTVQAWLSAQQQASQKKGE